MPAGLQTPLAAALDVCHVVGCRESCLAWLYTSPPVAICRMRCSYECIGESKTLSQKLLLSLFHNCLFSCWVRCLTNFIIIIFYPPPPPPLLWRGCCRFELGAGPADIHTLWVPDRCYLSNVLKVFGFAKSRAVPQHKHMGLLTHGAWQCSAAKAAVKLRFYHDRCAMPWQLCAGCSPAQQLKGQSSFRAVGNRAGRVFSRGCEGHR